MVSLSEATSRDDPLLTQPHRRYNPLTGNYVLVSPQRAARPWQGEVGTTPGPTAPSHDPSCTLCPGNVRSGGARNPDYMFGDELLAEAQRDLTPEEAAKKLQQALP